MRSGIRLVPVVIMLLTGASAPSAASAQAAGAFVLQIPVDARTEGMGRAWAPLVTSAFSAWNNPGGVGLLQGAHLARSRDDLAEGLAVGVVQEYRAAAIGHDFLVNGLPLNVGAAVYEGRLEYGEIQGTGPGGVPTQTFYPWEETEGLAVGLGVPGVVGIGFGYKRVEIDLGFGSYGDTHALDLGFLVRSPYVRIGEPETGKSGLSVSYEDGGWVSARALGGIAWMNDGSDVSLMNSPNSGDPLPHLRRGSVGLEVGAVRFGDLAPVTREIFAGILQDVRLVSLSAAYGEEASLVDDSWEGQDGWEVRILDVFSYRRGSIDDPRGKIQDTTEGWGVSLFGYLGYDHAEIPQAVGLPRVTKESWWVRVPFRLP